MKTCPNALPARLPMIWAALWSAAFWSCLVSAAPLPAPVSAALREARVPESAVSIVVRQADGSRNLIALNADRPMSPASTMKLLTTYAGLELLGPAYTWKTEVYADAPIKDGVMEGNLYIKGYGDPLLSQERLLALLETLRSTGLREIGGNLVIDDHWFEATSEDTGAFDGEPYRAYNAAPGALLVNYRATRFDFRADAATSRVNITAAPAMTPLRILNDVVLRQVPCADWKDRIGIKVDNSESGVTVAFSGSYSVACVDKSLELSVLNNTDYVHALFRSQWQLLGGTLRGGAKAGETPSGLQRLLLAESPPLAEVIRPLNKYSNNLMARQLLNSIGAEKQGAPGNPAKGIAAIETWMKAKKLDFPELTLENGAGLSRRERISAGHLADVLQTAWRSPVMPELFASLPVLAVDGTLQSRLKDSAVAGQGHFKTGSIDGVRAIAGLLEDQNGRHWIVVFMANHANAQATRGAQDALLEWLYSRKP